MRSQGRYDILTFTGSFVHSGTGGMSVSQISPEGRIIGGWIDGQLVAASPVQGRNDLLTFAGSYVHSETGGMRNLSGGMSVSLLSPEGRVIGGRIDGPLVAASPVQILLGILPEN